MLSVKDENTYKFVDSNAKRDEYEASHVAMYDVDAMTGKAKVAFDGNRWLVAKISVEPEQA